MIFQYNNYGKVNLCQLHQGKICLKICSHLECSQNSRWVCQECITQNIHQHDELFNAHIKSKQEFKQYLKQEKEELTYQQLMSMKIMKIEVQTINALIINIEEVMNKLEKISKDYQQIIRHISSLESILKHFNKDQMSQKEIDDILNIEKDKDKLFQFQDLQNLIKQMEKSINKLSGNISKAGKKHLITENVQVYFDEPGWNHYLQQNINNITNQEKFKMIQKQISFVQTEIKNIIPFVLSFENIEQLYRFDPLLEIQQASKQIVKPKYSNLEIKNDNQIQMASSISSDDKYLVYGCDDQHLYIYDLVDKKQKQKENVNCIPTYIIFTQDSNFLILGTYSGYVLLFDVNKDFSLNFKSKIHGDTINQIKCISNDEIISCSNDGKIIITNTSFNRQDLIIPSTIRNGVLSIDYDIQNRVIAAGLEYGSIKLFYQNNGQLLFQKEQAHRFSIVQMQIIQNKNKLVSLCELGELKIWYIDYRRKQLNQTSLISSENTIRSFLTSQDDDQLILVSQRFIQIHVKLSNLISQFDHKVDQCNYYYYLVLINGSPQLLISNHILVKGRCNNIFNLDILNIIKQEKQMK